MPAVNRVTRRDAMILLIILFAAALMRLGEPGVVEFKHDEAWLSRIILDWQDGGPLPLTGMPSSVGIPNSPISVYLLALPYALFHDPLAVTLFIAALNVVGVGLLWLIAHRYVGRTAALAAGLAYALHPWAILYSRKIWAQDMHTPFVLAALLLGLYGFVEGKRWAQILCLPLLMIALQIHFAAWALLPLWFVLVWMGRRRASWLAIGLSLVLAALTLLPFAAGVSQTLAQDPNRLNIALDGPTFALDTDTLASVAQLGTGLGVEAQVSPDAPDEVRQAVPPQPQLWALPGLLALVGLAAAWTRPYRPVALFVSVWAVLPIAVFLPGWTAVFPHYFVASIPAFCLLMGIGLAWLENHLPGQPLSRTVLLAGFAAIVLSQGIWWRGLLRYANTHETSGFGIPLGQRLPLRNALLAYGDVLLITEDDRLQYSEEPAVWDVLLHGEGRCFRAISNTDFAIRPAQPFAVLVTPDMQDSELAQAYVSEDAAHYPLASGSRYTLDTDTPAPEITLQLMEPVSFSSGARLAGYDVEDGNVRLVWRLPGPIRDDYQYFVHLLDANGERIAQQDRPFLAGPYWCDGDELLTTTALDVPAEAHTLRVGMYRLEGERFVNADVLDDAGNAAAPWYDIALTP